LNSREIEAVEKLLEEQKAKRIRKRRRKAEKMPHPYKFLIVIDFEATCFEKPHNRSRTQEIIEFPACVINLETGEITDEFHRYLQPVEIPILSDYCKNLTKISQETVDNCGHLLEDVMKQFTIWLKMILKEKNLTLPKQRRGNLTGNCLLVTWGNWDFLIQLKNECNRKKIRKPSCFLQWCDLKELYIETYKTAEKFTFGDALEWSNLEFVGQPHSGIADARMTASLAHKMYNEGAYFRVTKDLNQHDLNRPF